MKFWVGGLLALLFGLSAGFVLGAAAGAEHASSNAWPEASLPAVASAAADRQPAVGLAPEAGAVGPCQLLYIVDGDTVDLDCAAAGESPDLRVRLLRINTPERGKPGFRRSATALTRMLLDREVYIVHERPGQAEFDRYDRLLAYLYAGGTNVNVEMVRHGWSPFWKKYGEGRFAREFSSAERASLSR